MLSRRRLSIESMEKRLLLKGDVIEPGNGKADVCEKNPDHPNCAIVGDADGDGVGTFGEVFALTFNGLYEQEDLCATFEQGDFNQDGRWNTSDVVLFFQIGGGGDVTTLTFIPGLADRDCPPPDHAAVAAVAAALESDDTSAAGAIDLREDSSALGLFDDVSDPLTVDRILADDAIVI